MQPNPLRAQKKQNKLWFVVFGCLIVVLPVGWFLAVRLEGGKPEISTDPYTAEQQYEDWEEEMDAYREELDEYTAKTDEYREEPPSLTDPHRPVAKLENSRLPTALTGGFLALYLGLWFSESGFSLNLDVVNWTFLALTLLLCRSTRHFMYLVERSAIAAGPLILAYPFYAGIIGVMTDSGMASALADWFAGIATTQTLPLLAFGCAMIINLFIPSGGAQWMVQEPIFVEAAREVGVDLPLIALTPCLRGPDFTRGVCPS